MSDVAASDTDGAALTPRALVAGHGEFAVGIVSAVEQITGRGGVLVALTNRGLGADEIVRTLREAVASAGAHVIFTDLPAGSWTIAARRVRTRATGGCDRHGRQFVTSGFRLSDALHERRGGAPLGR